MQTPRTLTMNKKAKHSRLSISRQISEALIEALDEDFVEAVETGFYGDRFMTMLRELRECLVEGNVLQLDAENSSRVLMSKGDYWVDLDEVELTSEEIDAIMALVKANKDGYWVQTSANYHQQKERSV